MSTEGALMGSPPLPTMSSYYVKSADRMEAQ
jgi:hypothetical protein